MLRSGARWKDLPERFASDQTCHRRFQQRQADGTFEQIVFTLGEELRAKGRLDRREAHGRPLGVMIASASPHEVTLVEATIEMRFASESPKCLLRDLAYDSDALDARLLEGGIEMIAPNRLNRKVSTRDGRPLRRYRRRWKVERLIAWLHDFLRILVRWDYEAENYLAFVQLGCICCSLRVFRDRF